MHGMESEVSLTYWPTCTECQVSCLESDVRITYWPVCMECHVLSVKSDVRYIPCMECQVSSLESESQVYLSMRGMRSLMTGL